MLQFFKYHVSILIFLYVIRNASVYFKIFNFFKLLNRASITLYKIWYNFNVFGIKLLKRL